MNRLTEKNKFNTHYEISISKNLLQSAYDKLGKLEDLEEELGCPLDVRIKVIPNSYIYTFGTTIENQNIITRRKVFTIKEDGIEIRFNTLLNGRERGMTLLWKNYKKTWWLKEDKSE